MSKAIYEALIKAQKHIANPIMDGRNPHFKNRYATISSVIDAIKMSLLENDVFVYQTLGNENGRDFVATSLYHSNGESIDCGKIYLRYDERDMQKMGAAITYARRYSLVSLFCLGAEDDDAESLNCNNKITPVKAVMGKVDNKEQLLTQLRKLMFEMTNNFTNELVMKEICEDLSITTLAEIKNFEPATISSAIKYLVNEFPNKGKET